MLNRDHDPFLAQWDLDLTSHDAKQKYRNFIDFSKQQQVEYQVTKYIQEHIRFVVFRVEEKGKRIDFKKKLIGAVSLCSECCPSNNWLGNFSPEEKIRQSGLWNVNELYKTPFADTEYNKFEKTIIGNL